MLEIINTREEKAGTKGKRDEMHRRGFISNAGCFNTNAERK